jgi:hypothetical protein
MKRFIDKLFQSMLILCSTVAAAAGENSSAGPGAISLADLAARADLIALAQVRDTDYIYRREFPVEGSAFLQVLIAYKSGQRGDIIEVHEKGLHEHECYFPDPGVSDEGRRYLLFLQSDTAHPERYSGLSQGCALDVLVDKSYRYVLRLPANGINVADTLDDVAREYEFADPYAIEDDESLPPIQRENLLAAGLLTPRGNRYIYTRGVALSEVRKLMGDYRDFGADAQKTNDQVP